MPDRVLTDEELGKLYLETCHPSTLVSRAGLRAVEQAVLEKAVRPNIQEWERQARERERAAWDAAIAFLHDWIGRKDGESDDRARDRRYPAIPPEPKVVTGPSGTQYLIRDGKLHLRWNLAYAWNFANGIPVADVPTVADLMREGTNSVR